MKAQKKSCRYPGGEIKNLSHPWPRTFFRKCKVLQDFGTKYDKSRPTKYHGSSPIPRESFNRQQENKAIVNNEVDKIQPTQKVGATNHEAPEFLDSDYDANDLYKVDKISLEETKGKLD